MGSSSDSSAVPMACWDAAAAAANFAALDDLVDRNTVAFRGVLSGFLGEEDASTGCAVSSLDESGRLYGFLGAEGMDLGALLLLRFRRDGVEFASLFSFLRFAGLLDIRWEELEGAAAGKSRPEISILKDSSSSKWVRLQRLANANRPSSSHRVRKQHTAHHEGAHSNAPHGVLVLPPK